MYVGWKQNHQVVCVYTSTEQLWKTLCEKSYHQELRYHMIDVYNLWLLHQPPGFCFGEVFTVCFLCYSLAALKWYCSCSINWPIKFTAIWLDKWNLNPPITLHQLMSVQSDHYKDCESTLGQWMVFEHTCQRTGDQISEAATTTL